MSNVSTATARLRPALLLAALLVYVFAFHGSRGLWEPDEGRYVDVAVEMLRSGDFLVPRLHHEYVHLSKPPFTYWTVAGGLAAFGHSEWGARLPNAIAWILTILLVWRMARRLLPSRPELAAVVHATMLLPFVGANIVTTDTLLTFWETAAAAAFVAGWWGDRSTSRRWMIAMWAALGMGFLTKGPPTLMPLIGVLTVAAATEGRAGLRRLAPVLGLASFAVLGFGWYVAMVVRDPALMDYFLHDELVGRIATDQHDRNAGWFGAFAVYVPTILVGMLPWTWVAFRRWRGVVSIVVPRTWRDMARRDPVGLFLASWIVGAIVVFSLAQSRLQLYLLPLAPPAALLVARALASGWRWSRRTVGWIAIWMIALVGLRAGFAHAGIHRDARRMAHDIAAAVDTTPFNEIVFVGTRPIFGLSLYLDLEVEHVAPNQQALRESECHYCTGLLRDELRNDERWLFLVSPRWRDVFLRQVERAGKRATLEGAVSAGEIYRVSRAPPGP